MTDFLLENSRNKKPSNGQNKHQYKEIVHKNCYWLEMERIIRKECQDNKCKTEGHCILSKKVNGSHAYHHKKQHAHCSNLLSKTYAAIEHLFG